MKRNFVILAVGAMTLLTACNNDDDDGGGVREPASAEVPASATASTQAYFDYANSLSKSETASPLLVDKVVPPTTETGSPQAF